MVPVVEEVITMRRTALGSAVLATLALVAGVLAMVVAPRIADAADPPLNDNFPGFLMGSDGASSSSGQSSSTTVGSTVDPSDPSWVTNYVPLTVWWHWTAPATGRLAVDTCLSDLVHPPKLMALSGTNVYELSSIAGTLDDCLGGGSLAFDVIKGLQYDFVAGPSTRDPGNVGEVTLRWQFSADTPAANDTFPGDTVTGASDDATSHTLYATSEAGEPYDIGGSPVSTVWWSWTPDSSGRVFFDSRTSGSSQNLTVFTDTDPNSPAVSSLTLVAASDTQQVVFDAVAGTTYRVRMSGGDPQAVVTLTWGSVGGPPANDDYADAALLDETGTATSGTITATNWGATGETYEWEWLDYLGGTSVWWRWTAPATGLLAVDLFGSDFDTDLGIFTGTAPVTGEDWENLEWVADNDDYDAFDSYISRVDDVLVTAGTEYHIGVGGDFYNGDPPGFMGDITLHWAFAADTANPQIDSLGATVGKSYTGTPAVGSYKIVATFAGSDDLGVDRYECQLDGTDETGWTTCTSPYTFSNVSTGSHTVYVRAFDVVGKVSATVSDSVTVSPDETTPVISDLATSVPKGKGATNTLVVSFTITDADHTAYVVTECSVDGTTWMPCTSPQTLVDVSGGLQTVTVRATDPFGNGETATAPEVRVKGPSTSSTPEPSGETLGYDLTTVTSGMVVAETAVGNLSLHPTPISEAGTITQFQVYSVPAAKGGAVTFDIWSPTGTSGEYQLKSTTRAYKFSGKEGVLTFSLTKGVPVAAGDLFGLYAAADGAPISLHYLASTFAELYAPAVTVHDVGATVSGLSYLGTWAPNVSVTFVPAVP